MTHLRKGQLFGMKFYKMGTKGTCIQQGTTKGILREVKLLSISYAYVLGLLSHITDWFSLSRPDNFVHVC